jgi:(p)ppGpp synthase/HD superfamily hydrolase
MAQLLQLCAGDERTQMALEFAAEKLDGRRRGGSQEPALVHAVRVAATIAFTFGETRPEILAAALLHDVLEDSDAEIDELTATFGEEIAGAVVLLTKPVLFSKADRKRIFEEGLLGAGDDVLMVKLADYYDNLQRRRGTARVMKTWTSCSRFVGLLLRGRRLRSGPRRAAAIVQALVAELGSEIEHAEVFGEHAELLAAG